jgi:hypothetical protein
MVQRIHRRKKKTINNPDLAHRFHQLCPFNIENIGDDDEEEEQKIILALPTLGDFDFSTAL